MSYYVVKYSGPFGFIKPWTAVRDSETFSQQFLTPSIVEGIRQKLEVKRVLRHKLTYDGISRQQEVIHTRGWRYLRSRKLFRRDRSILTRGVMINPDLLLAFEDEHDAVKASSQHICLCRNEDLMLPNGQINKMSETDFDDIPGFELRFGQQEGAILVGFDRFRSGEPMYGRLVVSGNPLKTGKVV